MTSKQRLVTAFTLIELMVCMVVIFILAALLFQAVGSIRDRSKTIQCVTNLRGIVAGAIAWANDRGGMLWSNAEIGNSKYRMAEDPLGLPELLKNYVPKSRWLCPAGRSTLDKFGNNYAWTVASQFDNAAVSTIERPKTTVIVWDAFSYSLPSMKNAAEDPSGSAGPSALNAKFQIKPHAGQTLVNYGFLDGHVETK